MKIKNILSLCLVLFSLACSAKTLTLYLENDFAFGTDMDYTHGTEIRYMHGAPKLGFSDVGFSVMQMMYAPDNISSTEIQEDDRPYCGILGLNLIGKKYRKNHVDDLQLTLGVIGEYSYSENTQRLIHKMIDCAEPAGWHNQLSNEAIVNVEFRRTYDKQFELSDWLYFDIEPGLDIQAGTWNNNAEIFLDFRLGNYDKFVLDHGITQRGIARFKYWLLTGIAGKNVWYSTQLDGNVFSDPPHHVESEDFVGEFHYGIGLGYDSFDIQIMNIHKTKEYTVQDDSVKFSVLAATWRF